MWQAQFARIHTVGYSSKAAADNKAVTPLERREHVVTTADFAFDINGNTLRQAYEYLKTQAPEFAGAVDIFEQSQM